MSADGPIDEALVQEYLRRLRLIRYEPVGFIERLVISMAHDDHRVRDELHIVPGVGVAGDHAWKQWGKGKRIAGRQVSAINADVLDALQIGYDVPGDNLIVRGFDLATLKQGDTVRIGDMVLVATGAKHGPCKVFEQRTSAEKKEAVLQSHSRGILLDALEEGRIRIGDTVERIYLKELRNNAPLLASPSSPQ